jgi:hypothetical protein
MNIENEPSPRTTESKSFGIYPNTSHWNPGKGEAFAIPPEMRVWGHCPRRSPEAEPLAPGAAAVPGEG